MLYMILCTLVSTRRVSESPQVPNVLLALLLSDDFCYKKYSHFVSYDQQDLDTYVHMFETTYSVVHPIAAYEDPLVTFPAFAVSISTTYVLYVDCYGVFTGWYARFYFEYIIPEFTCVASIVEKCFIVHLRLSMFLIIVIDRFCVLRDS